MNQLFFADFCKRDIVFQEVVFTKNYYCPVKYFMKKGCKKYFVLSLLS